MARKEIRFAGFGGQGLLLAGIILGRTACIYQELQATQTQSYGTEARGGASRCDVVIDEKEITFTGVTRPDIFVVMSQEAYDRFIETVKEGAVVYYDSDLVNVSDRPDTRQIPIPATKIAIEKLNNRIVANIVMLGAMAEGSRLVAMDNLQKSLEESVPAGTEAFNLRAFEEGRSIGAKAG